MISAKRQLKWTAKAAHDVERIKAYRTKNHSETVAENVLAAIKKTAEGLLAYPERGKAAEYDPKHRHEVVKEYPYTIVYRLAADAQVVYVMQIWQHPQNYKRA